MEKIPSMKKIIERAVTNGRGYDSPRFSDAKEYPNARTEENRLMTALYHLPINMRMEEPAQPTHRFCHQLCRYIPVNE